MEMLKTALTVFFIFFFSLVHAQQIYHLKVVPADKDTVTLHNLAKYRSTVSDSITATKELNSVFNQLLSLFFPQAALKFSTPLFFLAF